MLENLINDYKNKTATMKNINAGDYDPLFGKPTEEQKNRLKNVIQQTKEKIINMIKEGAMQGKPYLSEGEYNKYVELTFNNLVNSNLAFEEYKELEEIQNKMYKGMELTDENSIKSFLNFIGVGFDESAANVIKGKVWAAWKIRFLKNGEISFNARGVTKRFNVSNGLELKNIFKGFEIV